jgi:hypothetical protein
MKSGFRIAVTVVLVSIALALGVGVVLLHDWGGRMEAILLVFGDRVWVTLDTARPRVLLLLLMPGLLLGVALFRHLPRRGRRQ